jgi:thiol-disulfide isomerase/thioredoxin
MIKYFSFLLSAMLLFSCGSSEETEVTEDKPEDNFTISGTIKDASNSALYLEALSEQGSIVVSEGKVGPDGNFSLSGNIPGMGIYQMRLGEAQDKIIPLTLVPKDKLKINTSFSDFAIKPNVSGTEWSSVMNEYMNFFSVFMSGQQRLNAMQGKASESEMMALYMELRKPLDKFALDKMQEDPDNPYNIVLSTSATPITGFKDWDPKNLEVLKIVAEAYKKRYKDSPMAATMENQVMQIESAYNEFKANENGGQSNSGVVPEIALKNPAGKVIKLSSLRGKIVLIDFWASWCGPCRRENPNVVKLYNQYKDKGFTVYSVSLDEDAAAWKNAIAADGLAWPNHVSDLLGWKTPMTQLYGFNSIPHTVLIDKEGKVIGTGLRGEILEQKLKEVLSK